ncbi:unnamed protein product, partial [Rotaria socialis]
MATSLLPNDDNNHFETPNLIWLDAAANSPESEKILHKLRTISSNFKKFDDKQEFQEYIEQQSPRSELVVVFSGRFGREIVPSVHQLRQIISIYVFCMDKEGNEKWASKFPKVKAVVVKLDKLISRIKADHKIQHVVDKPSSVESFASDTYDNKMISGPNAKFIGSQVMIDCLLRVKFTPKDKTELIDYCNIMYAGNHAELQNIRDFEQNYLPDKALWWYTKDSFFYKILNKALRGEDIHMMFLLRAFISDIGLQLKKYQAKQHLRAYRSQMISNDELETFKKSCGLFMSPNSFFSSTLSRHIALSFLRPTNNTTDLQSVLFEIDADPKIVTTKPFADISKHSNFSDESEVLFMTGSIFRLNSISRSSDDQVWIIQMTLCNENDDECDIKYALMYKKQEIGTGETTLRTFGNLLWKLGKHELAQKYLVRFLEELPSNDPSLISLYEDLGELASETGDYNKSVQWHQKALELKNKNQSTSITKTDAENNSI